MWRSTLPVKTPSLFIITRASLEVQSGGKATKPLALFGHGRQLVKIKFFIINIMKEVHL
jgi:hypothetical protein